MSSPTQRTLAHLRKQGYTADVVERWIPRANVRKDLFGVIDVIAIGNGETLGVQCTSYPNVSSRVKKIEACDALPELRRSGWRLLVHGWRKPKTRWEVREVEV